MRTFIAIALPEAAQRIIAQLQQGFAHVRGVRVSRPEQTHLTLKFLDEIDRAQAPAFLAELGRIQEHAFELSLTKLGAFPNAHRPRVLWVGVSSPPELALLARSVDSATSAIAQDKPFNPHITLARVTPSESRFDPAALDVAVPECRFEVTEFACYESVLAPAGSKYNILQKFALLH